MADPVVYSEGDMVYNHRLCITGDIMDNGLGLKSYCITDVESGTECKVKKHNLEPVNAEKIILPNIGWDTELIIIDVKEPNVVNTSPAAGNKKSHKMHLDLSDKEINEVANQKLSENTEHQTKWQVALI